MKRIRILLRGGFFAVLSLSWFISSSTLSQEILSQVEVGGEVVFELSRGGRESNFIYNEIPNAYRNWHPSITQFNLFLNALLTDEVEVNTRLLLDTWGTGELNTPRLALAAVLWTPAEEITFSAGRIISPIGLFPRRQLQSQTIFANSPLTYNYHTKISAERGFWPAAGASGTAYTGDDVGTTVLNFAAYTTGGSVNWRIVPDRLNLEVALLAASPNQSLYTNLANAAVAMRVGFSPAIFWQQGISLSYGGFMQASGVNAIARTVRPFEQFRQFLLSTDLILAYSYYELSGEVFYSNWSVPKFTSQDGFRVTDGGGIVTHTLSSISGYLDAKFEPPFLTGSVIALRYERLDFLEYQDPISGEALRWDRNVQRLSLAFGYKPVRGVLLKAAVSDQVLGGDRWQSVDDYTIRIMVVASF